MAVDIDNIRRRLLIKYPPFGSTMAGIQFVEDDTCYYKGHPTAATDNDKVYYHPDFINNLNENQQVTVFAHEIAHIVLDHINRSNGRDPDTWNTATDAVINANLKKDGLELIPGMIEKEDALYYDEETLYEKLYHEKKQNNDQNNKQNNGQNNGQNNENPPASHERWKNANKKDKESNDSSSNDYKEKKAKMNANELFEGARKERLENLKNLRKSLVEKAAQNSSPNPKNRNIDHIGSETKLVNWRQILKDTCKIDKDWSYQNATIEYGVLTPHMEDLPMPETEIVLDTSGSIDEQLLRSFLRECLGILQQSKIKVGCFDERFYGFTDVRTKKDIENLPLVGGGGTDFDAAVNAFSKSADNKIIFTDGYASMPSKEEKAIWIVFSNKKINPKGGKVIYVDEYELRKLHYDSESNQKPSNRNKS